MTVNDTIGVDISKPTLEAFRPGTGEHRPFSNDRSSCAALIGRVGSSQARIIFEPTGPDHRLFEASPVCAGIEMVKVNPRAARRFAEATGALARTDRIDAAILARTKHETRTWSPYTTALKQRGSLSVWFDPDMDSRIWTGGVGQTADGVGSSVSLQPIARRSP